jgi:hypothetical protein
MGRAKLFSRKRIADAGASLHQNISRIVDGRSVAWLDFDRRLNLEFYDSRIEREA